MRYLQEWMELAWELAFITSIPDTKLMGALKLESIRQALQIRDEAEASIAGKAAILLSRLDRLYFENLLQEEDEPLWLKLYEAILARNTHQTEKLMDKFNHIHLFLLELNLHSTVNIGSATERMSEKQ